VTGIIVGHSWGRPRQVEQDALFYEFSIESHVPADHLVRSIDRFVELGELRRQLAPFYSETGRPSVDPELMIRMLIIGYCLGIRSERRLCEEVHLNLAYRWFFAQDGQAFHRQTNRSCFLLADQAVIASSPLR